MMDDPKVRRSKRKARIFAIIYAIIFLVLMLTTVPDVYSGDVDFVSNSEPIENNLRAAIELIIIFVLMWFFMTLITYITFYIHSKK